MNIDEKTFRQSMSYWATGVTVVASIYEGKAHGMTVSSFTSVSANPPVVCISLNQQARTHQLVEQSGVFAVTILEEAQGPISDCFAGRIPEDGDRFFGLDTFTLETKSPFIAGGIAFFDCKVVGKTTFGQNTVFFGEVVASQSNDAGRPLLYSNRAYQSLHK
jgi:flavin reductase (DIM6/NTAB) family NADH-FMN oxidoreductase RutF